MCRVLVDEYAASVIPFHTAACDGVVCHLSTSTMDYFFRFAIRFDHHYTRPLYLTLYKMNQHNIIADNGLGTWRCGVRLPLARVE